MYPSRSLAEQSTTPPRKTSLPALPLRAAISFPEADVTPIVEVEVDPEPGKVTPPPVEEAQSPGPPTPEPVKPQLESKPALARSHNLEGRNDFHFYSQSIADMIDNASGRPVVMNEIDQKTMYVKVLVYEYDWQVSGQCRLFSPSKGLKEVCYGEELKLLKVPSNVQSLSLTK